MSTTAWYVKIVDPANGTIIGSLGSLGIINPRCIFRSLDDDQFTFDIKQSATATPSFSFGDPVTLYKVVGGASTVWFVGTISHVVQVGTAQDEIVRYVCSNAWFQLRRTMWQVSTKAYNASCGLVPVLTTKCVLYQDPAAGAHITTGAQITNVLSYALTLGIPVAAGSIIPASVYVPIEETRDLTLADVIRRAMQWTPDAVSWFNYSSGAAVFNAAQRASLTPLTLNIASANVITRIAPVQRSDLVPSGILFNYISSAYCNVIVPTGCADPSTGIVNAGAPTLSQHPVAVTIVTQDSAGLPGTAGALVGTVDLTQLTATLWESAPIGLAAQYYASLVTAFWDGEIETHEQECSGQLRPGIVLNLSNGTPAWASMNAQIQEVREDLYDGKTLASFGLPGHLQPQNFNTLIQMTARRALQTTGMAATGTAGTGNGTSCQVGLHPQTTKVINALGAGGSSNTGARAGAAIGAQGLNAALNTCSINVCKNGVSTPISLYCPPQNLT